MPASNSSITRAAYGTTPDGQPVELFTLRNRNGIEAQITNYGGIITALKVPDKQGQFADVVLGFDKLEGYTNCKGGPYFGALIGRYGNRIAKGTFSIDGRAYTLAKNNGENALHGGLKGFDKVVWQVIEAGADANDAKLKLFYLSPDGEEGYPGNLKVHATYTLTGDNCLKLDCEAVTDQPTVCNLTQHSYFNLAGQGRGNVLDHVVHINADRFTAVVAGSIPTGELRSVKGTPLDFLQPAPIGRRLGDDYEQLKLTRGYDHNFVLNKQGNELSLAARAQEPASGRILEVWTTEPGVQFYSGNYLSGQFTGKNNLAYPAHSGFCFEPQHFPDSPNHPEFPGTWLRPGETYHNTIIYKLGVA